MDTLIHLRDLSKSYQNKLVVDGLDLSLEEGEFFALLGPSGCGKSSTLRMIAGFEQPDRGSIVSRGQDWSQLPVRARNCHMVFQHYALFPHMTVYENVAFGLEMRRLSAAEIAAKTRETLALVQMEAFADRKPAQLSGGQQQRVALARAIAPQPALLLLDEPLSALDQQLRLHMRAELKQIQRQLKSTFLFVTHDQEEALSLSDRMGIMDHGRLLQVGSPQALYEQPASEAVARFLGEADIWTFQPLRQGSDALWNCPQSGLAVTLSGAAQLSGPQRVALRPEFWEIRSPDSSEGLPARLLDKSYRGGSTTYTAELATGQTLKVATASGLTFSDQEQVRLCLKRTQLWALPEHSS